jgi:pimeloyl-ACP methyl ester carboxylesterase
MVVLVAGATFYYTEVIEDELLVVTASLPDRDPSDVNIVYEDVTIVGPLGPLQAWYSSGVDDTWMLLVHGHDGSRSDTLAAMPVPKRLGIPVLVVSYRNGPGAPSSPNEHFGLGRNEWPDLEAAAEYAIAAGAEDLVIAGFGSGASVAAAFVHDSGWADRVKGLVFDSPLLDGRAVISERARAENVPGFIPGWANGVAALRFGVDWAKADQLRRAEEFTVPILLIHGSGDDRIPVETSDRFADSIPDLVTYERYEGVGHLEAVAADPERYETALRAFLTEVAVGPSDLDPIDRQQ